MTGREEGSQRESLALLERALASIPGGSSTSRKAAARLVPGVQPLFSARARGAYFVDTDGNEWLDAFMALGTVILGHAHPEITEAVQREVANGCLHSVVAPLEVEVAEMLLRLMPEYSGVRFSKTGADATSCVVRLARAATGRDRIVVCGYHGCHDWSVAHRPGVVGVPEAVRALTTSVHWDDMATIPALLDARPSQYAAVVVDPADVDLPSRPTLVALRNACSRAGTVLVFDEIVSGFRSNTRGIIGLTGVVPDALCLGKAIANGFPLAALLVQDSLAAELPRTGWTSTYAGDAIALRAAAETLRILARDSVATYVWAQGDRLAQSIRRSFKRSGADQVIAVRGYPAMIRLRPVSMSTGPVQAAHTLSVLMTELARMGVFAQDYVALSCAHDDAEIGRLEAAFEAAAIALAKQLPPCRTAVMS